MSEPQAPTSCRCTITTDKRLPWQLVARNIFEKVRLVYFSLKREGRRGVLVLNREHLLFTYFTQRGDERERKRAIARKTVEEQAAAIALIHCDQRQQRYLLF